MKLFTGDACGKVFLTDNIVTPLYKIKRCFYKILHGRSLRPMAHYHAPKSAYLLVLTRWRKKP